MTCTQTCAFAVDVNGSLHLPSAIYYDVIMHLALWLNTIVYEARNLSERWQHQYLYRNYGCSLYLMQDGISKFVNRHNRVYTLINSVS